MKLKGCRMFHWLQKQLISDEAADWIDECAVFVMQQAGTQAFWQHTRLILPDIQDFPQKVSGPEPMAQYILSRVTQLAGVPHWPWLLVDARQAPGEPPQRLGLNPGERFRQDQPPIVATAATTALQVPYVIDQIRKPQDLVASIAHTCAQHMLWQSQQTPPGGIEYFEQAAEVMATFLGFGIMLTNSAYTYRGSCASCYNPRANRQASLSESESLYALALFCHIRQEPVATVLKYLKPHLKSSFKVALKQIRGRMPAFPERGLVAAE